MLNVAGKVINISLASAAGAQGYKMIRGDLAQAVMKSKHFFTDKEQNETQRGCADFAAGNHSPEKKLPPNNVTLEKEPD